MAGLGHPSTFKRVSRLGSLLHCRRSTEVNQTLHDVWLRLSPGLADYAYIGPIHFRELWPPNGILPRAIFTLRPSLSFSYIGSVTACTALQQRASAKLCGVVQGMELWYFRRGRHLYSAGPPSRWALANILVSFFFLSFFLA